LTKTATYETPHYAVLSSLLFVTSSFLLPNIPLSTVFSDTIYVRFQEMIVVWYIAPIGLMIEAEKHSEMSVNTKLQGAISQKTDIFILVAVRT
jgi:hypothetical protein